MGGITRARSRSRSHERAGPATASSTARATSPARGNLCGHFVLAPCDRGSNLDLLRRQRCFGTETAPLGLVLSLEEALFLQLDSVLVICEGPAVLSKEAFFERCCSRVPNFPACFVTYRHYRQDGWVVRPDALKFGCHFLLYEGSPSEVHARYSVILADEKMLWKDAIMASRLAQIVAKELLLVFLPDCKEVSLEESCNMKPLALTVRPWHHHLGT
ncbi:unnamed protein product [Durusdinium trenchii]|uniref:tRNA-intron lyase n=1 Tax=Durusdinium trenchii TaxID=1381693 RepID=A0ABP0PT49_9DINO